MSRTDVFAAGYIFSAFLLQPYHIIDKKNYFAVFPHRPEQNKTTLAGEGHPLSLEVIICGEQFLPSFAF